MKPIILTAILALSTSLVSAQTAAPVLTGQRAHVAQVLPFYGYRNVNVRDLRTSQVAQISFLAHSNKSHGEVKGQIGAVLRGGILQRAIESVLR